jgi:hypothetical protein
MSPRRLLAAAACAVSLAPTLIGCTLEDPQTLRDVAWAEVTGINLNCRGEVEQVGDDHHHDVTGDGEDEAFVAMRCAGATAGQLEVYGGTSDPRHPRRLMVLVHREEGVVLDTCVFFTGAWAIAIGRSGGAPVRRQATWDNDKREPLFGSPTSVSTASALGCP